MALMAKTKRKKQKPAVKTQELDSIYFLKMVLYLIVGSQWLWFVDAGGAVKAPVPIGLLIGVLFAVHEHFRLDRKVEYAVLLVAMLIGFATQYGIYITI